MPVSRALRVLISLAIAVPMGPGGLCCCIVGGDHVPAAVAQARAAAETHPCCIPPAPSAPVDRSDSSDRDDCGCPKRDDAVLVAANSDAAFAAPAPAPLFMIVAAAPAARAVTLTEARFGAEGPSPVPKLPRYRTLCVLLC